MAVEDQFLEILRRDMVTYQSLAVAKALISDGSKRVMDHFIGDQKGKIFGSDQEALAFESKMDVAAEKWRVLSSEYSQRQADIQNGLGDQDVKPSDSPVFKFLDDLLKRFGIGSNEVGIIPFLIPIVIGAAVVLGIGIVSFFTEKYFSKSKVDMDKALILAAEMGETNPEFADRLLKAIAKAQNRGGAGAGGVIVISLIVAALLAGGGYLIINKTKKKR